MAKRVSVHDGKVMTSDGPFAEVKEHLAGFYLVECESMDRARRDRGPHPGGERRCRRVEVRPVLDLSGLEM